MRSSLVSRSILAVLCLASVAAGAPTALIAYEGSSTLRNNHQGTVGMIFRTGGQDLWATDLGIYDEAWDGLQTAHDVGVWRNNTAEPLRSVTVPAGTGGVLDGAFRYAPTAPALMQADEWYVIGAQYPGGGSGDRFRDHNGGQTFDLTYINPATNTRASRWVSSTTLTNPGNQPSLNTAYVGPNIKLMPAPAVTVTNLAPGGTATGSSEGFGSVFADANDGNRDGQYGNGSVWHTADPETSFPSHYQIDLGDRYHLDRIQIFPRTDMRQRTVENFRLTVYEDDGAGNPGSVSWSQDYLPGTWADYPWAAAIPAGVAGRHVRMERLDNNPTFLTFAEMEVFGRLEPIGVNLAAGQPVVASPAGWGSAPGDGNDNDLNSFFYHPDRPVYHSAAAGVGQFWQVDLGATYDLDFLELFQRGDGQNTSEYLIHVLEADAATIAYSAIVASPQYDLTLALEGISGRYVRVETTRNEFLAFTELRVLALEPTIIPEPSTLLVWSLLAGLGIGAGWYRRER